MHVSLSVRLGKGVQGLGLSTLEVQGIGCVLRGSRVGQLQVSTLNPTNPKP